MAGQPKVIGPGNVAVVTGAASGIGFAVARRCAGAGMKVVLADVEPGALAAAQAQLAQDGHEVTSVVTDVANASQVDNLRDVAVETFGAVHLLVNNAGVGSTDQPVWLMPKVEWDWVFRVNLDGVMNGIRSFVPILLEQSHAYVVNTSSAFGLFTGCRGPYGVSKHAVVALSETLYFQFASEHPNIGISVLCPGAVRTRITESDRNRPGEVRAAATGPGRSTAEIAALDNMIRTGKDPDDVADLVVDAIAAGRFYVLTHANRDDAIRRRADEILSGGPPQHPLA